MPALLTDPQLLVFKGTRIPASIQIVIEEYCSSVCYISDYRRSCNMPTVMDERAGQGENTLLESPKL
jgi:hypothetical protein